MCGPRESQPLPGPRIAVCPSSRARAWPYESRAKSVSGHTSRGAHHLSGAGSAVGDEHWPGRASFEPDGAIAWTCPRRPSTQSPARCPRASGPSSGLRPGTLGLDLTTAPSEVQILDVHAQNLVGSSCSLIEHPVQGLLPQVHLAPRSAGRWPSASEPGSRSPAPPAASPRPGPPDTRSRARGTTPARTAPIPDGNSMPVQGAGQSPGAVVITVLRG